MEKNNALDSMVKYVHYSVNFLSKTDEFDMGFALENGKEYPLKNILYCLAYIEKYESFTFPPMKGYYYELLSQEEKKLFSDVVMKEYISNLWLSASQAKNSSVKEVIFDDYDMDSCYKDFFYFKTLSDNTFDQVNAYQDLPVVKWLKTQMKESENPQKIIETYCYDNEKYIGSVKPLDMEKVIHQFKFEDFKFAYYGLNAINDVVKDNKVYKDFSQKNMESVYIDKWKDFWSGLGSEKKFTELNENQHIIFYAMDVLKKNESAYPVMTDIFNCAIENSERLSHKSVMKLTNKLTNLGGSERAIQDKLYPTIEWSRICNKLIKETHLVDESGENLYRIEISYTNLLMWSANLPKFINIPNALGALEDEEFEVASNNQIVERLGKAIQDLGLLLSVENPELLSRIMIDDKKSGASRLLLEVRNPSKSEKDFLKIWVKTGLYKSDAMRKKGNFTSSEVEAYYNHVLMSADLEKNGVSGSKLKVKKF